MAPQLMDNQKKTIELASSWFRKRTITIPHMMELRIHMWMSKCLILLGVYRGRTPARFLLPQSHLELSYWSPSMHLLNKDPPEELCCKTGEQNADKAQWNANTHKNLNQHSLHLTFQPHSKDSWGGLMAYFIRHDCKLLPGVLPRRRSLTNQ